MEKIEVIGKRAHDEEEARINIEQGDDMILVEFEDFGDLMTRLEVAARTLGWTKEP